MARNTTGLCPKGHRIAGKNVVMRKQWSWSNPYKSCRKCYNAMRNKRAKLKYRNDPEWRDKKKAKVRGYQANKVREMRCEGLRQVPARSSAGDLPLVVGSHGHLLADSVVHDPMRGLGSCDAAKE